MSTTWMMTIDRHPERESVEEVKLLQWILKHDVHDWIIAKETGTFGYHHWQIRMRTNLTFDEMKQNFPTAHIEQASDNYDYERKDGNYLSSTDTKDILKTRYAELRPNQRRILTEVGNSNDRSICCVIDNKGNTGKSFLARHLYETGRAFYVPPTCTSPQTIIQFVASGYRGEPIIVVDIPRSTRWTNQLYIAIETIKDGLVYDTRYRTTIRDIFGVNVLVFCNNKPNLSKLSSDRWVLLDSNGVRYEPSKRNTRDGSIPLGIE